MKNTREMLENIKGVFSWSKDRLYEAGGAAANIVGGGLGLVKNAFVGVDTGELAVPVKKKIGKSVSKSASARSESESTKVAVLDKYFKKKYKIYKLEFAKRSKSMGSKGVAIPGFERPKPMTFPQFLFADPEFNPQDN